MVMVGGIEATVREAVRRQHRPDQDQRGAGDAAALDQLGNLGERAADHLLVRPGGTVDHHHRAGRAVMRQQLARHPDQVVDREMDRQGRTGRGKRRQLLARGHVRGPHRRPGQDHRLADVGQGQLLAEQGGTGGEGGHAGRHVIGDAERLQPPDLLADRAIQRRIAGMDPGDIEPGRLGRHDLGDDRGQIQGCGVDHARRPIRVAPGLGDHLGRHQRAGIEHDRAGPDQAQAAQRDQIGGARAGADEVHGHAEAACAVW